MDSFYALVAEQVDAADLKSVGSNPVPVRFRPSAPTKKPPLAGVFFVGMIVSELNRRFGIEHSEIERALPKGNVELLPA